MMKKENLMPVIVLTVICLVAALLMGVVNMISAPIIEEAKNAAANAALLEVLPEGKNFKAAEITADFPKEITKAYKADGGYVFEANVSGNKPGMTVMCGIDTEGKVVGVEVISNDETPSYWEKVYSVVTGIDSIYSGKTNGDIEPEIITGATKSSTAVYNAVKASLNAHAVMTGGEVDEGPAETLPKTDEEIIALAETLLGALAGTLTDVTPEDTADVKRVYRDSAKKNYAVYAVVMSQYGTVETETLLHIGSDGLIKNVNKLTWKTSDAMYGYVPPKEDEVNPFYESLIGKNSETIGNVELVTNATNTSTNLRNSVAEAIDTVNKLVKADMPTAEEIVMEKAAELLGIKVGDLVDVTVDGAEYVKRIYRDKSGRNYVAYTVVMSQYGTVETETLTHIGTDGVIKNINKMIWKTSDAMYGYVPPTEAEVSAFYDRLEGKSLKNIGEVELVTNATNTSTNLVNSITEALTAVEGFDYEPDTIPVARITGVLILAFGIGAAVAYASTKAIIRRKRK